MTVFRFPRSITPVAHSASARRRFRWHPGALVVAALLALLVASPAFSALRIGTKNAETLTGTKGNDHLTGAEGNDLLKGLAGNDTYFFADDWGVDELVEKPGEGTDTLNFRGVRTSALDIHLVREWDPTFSTMFADGPGGAIDFSTAAGQATIEKVIGGQGDGDLIETGSGPHTLQPGGGANDEMHDAGGYNDGPGGLPDVPVSNDIFKGFGDNTGTDLVFDLGGTKDVVDMRPFSTDDVYISRFDADPTSWSNQTGESADRDRADQPGHPHRPLQRIPRPYEPVKHAGAHREADLRRRHLHLDERSRRRDGVLGQDHLRQTGQARGGRGPTGGGGTRATAGEMPEPGTRRGSGEDGDEGGPTRPLSQPGRQGGHEADPRHQGPAREEAARSKSTREQKRAPNPRPRTK